MKPKLTISGALMTVLFVLVGLVATVWFGLRRIHPVRRWHTTKHKAIATSRHVARWWTLRAIVAEEMDALEARFNNYFKELVIQLLPHERDLVERHYQEAELFLRRARIQRRLGRFGSARSLVSSADFTIDRACQKLPADRRVVWSEVCHYQ